MADTQETQSNIQICSLSTIEVKQDMSQINQLKSQIVKLEKRNAILKKKLRLAQQTSRRMKKNAKIQKTQRYDMLKFTSLYVNLGLSWRKMKYLRHFLNPFTHKTHFPIFSDISKFREAIFKKSDFVFEEVYFFIILKFNNILEISKKQC